MVSLGSGNPVPGIVREITIRGVMALVKVQIGDSVFEFPVSRDLVEDMGLKVGATVTALIDSIPVTVEK